MIVYLDTISINRLFEELNKKIGLKSLKKYNYALSSCQIDELCGIKSVERRSQIVEFLYKISDKKKLKDNIEIMASETLHELGKERYLSYIDPLYGSYNDMIKEVIKKRFPSSLQNLIDYQIKLAKRMYREEENIIRQTFKSFFSFAEKLGYKKRFEKIFCEMLKDGQINDFLYKNLVFEEEFLGYSFSSIKEDIYNLDVQKLKCTFVGIQAKVAYSYLASFEKGKISKLKDSDQSDVRHLFYLNYADIFVTDDEKMQKITKDIMQGITSKVENTDSFIENYF